MGAFGRDCVYTINSMNALGLQMLFTVMVLVIIFMVATLRRKMMSAMMMVVVFMGTTISLT